MSRNLSLVLLVAAALVSLPATAQRLKDLAGVAGVRSNQLVGYGLVVMNMLNDLGIRPRVQAVVDNVETMKVMVQMGMGLALIPDGAADNEAKLGLLEPRPISPAHRIVIESYRPREGLTRHRELLHAAIVGSMGAQAGDAN